MKEVLIVEDDEGCMSIYKYAISDFGNFNITGVRSEKEAKRYLNKKFDYLILDGFRGACFSLYPKIKADKKIIITGTEEIFKACKSRNIKSLLKPIKIKELEEFLK